jgi:hypothetical protein
MNDRYGPGTSQDLRDSAEQDKGLRFAKAHALVIAVANYQDVNPLPGSVLDDARDIVSVLTAANYCGYDPKQVHMLLDREATLTAIRQGLAGLIATSASDDTVIIFFSGHGARITSDAHETSVLLPVDCHQDDLQGTTFSEAAFSNVLAAIPARRLVVFLDACHSGGAGSLKGGLRKDLQIGFDEKSLERLAQGTGRVIIASSRASETSLVLKGARNSVFTTRLLEALRGHARTRGDGLIRIFEVFNYVSEKVRGTVPGRQHPVFKASDLEDNFPIALDQGATKHVNASAPTVATPWRQLEDILADLYPAGPLDQEIWARAGGDVSRLRLTGTGRAMWFSALRTLRQGGGGKDIGMSALARTALEDFPHHPDLKALTSGI